MRINFTWMLFVAGLFASTLSAQTIVYVNQSAAGQNNGSSWADAYNNLQVALQNAPSGAALWVATGTYKPAMAASPKNRSFTLTKSVSLYGGFDGTETSLQQRALTNRTVLDGDILGNDAGTLDYLNPSRSENAWSVITVSGTGNQQFVVDGFDIINGNAPDSIPGAGVYGGAFYVEANNDQVIFSNCLFTKNSAQWGSVFGINGKRGSVDLLIHNSEMTQNISKGHLNGAYYDGHNSNIRLVNTLVHQNTFYQSACIFAGGLQNHSFTLLNCTITNNQQASATARKGTYAEHISPAVFLTLAPNRAGQNHLKIYNTIVEGNLSDTLVQDVADKGFIMGTFTSIDVQHSRFAGIGGVDANTTLTDLNNIRTNNTTELTSLQGFNHVVNCTASAYGNASTSLYQNILSNYNVSTLDFYQQPRIQGDLDMGCAESPIQFTAPTISEQAGTLVASSGYASYQWIDPNGLAVTGATSPQFTPPTSGTYSVEAVNTTGCAAASSYTFVQRPLAPQTTNPNFTAYPNPTSNQITLDLPRTQGQTLVRIMSQHGQVIYQNTTTHNQLSINLSSHAAGLYTVYIQNPQGTQQLQIVKR